MDKIASFRGENYFLSNYYSAPITYDGITYSNNEAAFQAQKCENKDDRFQFSTLPPNAAKALGRHVDLRKDWENIKEQIMYEVVFAKFSQNPPLKEKLLATGDKLLEEGNTWGDVIWGTVNGKGQNKLGKILMKIREKLR